MRGGAAADLFNSSEEALAALANEGPEVEAGCRFVTHAALLLVTKIVKLLALEEEICELGLNKQFSD